MLFRGGLCFRGACWVRDEECSDCESTTNAGEGSSRVSLVESISGYRPIRKIADGGCAEIYEAEEVGSNQRVAIKILHAQNHQNLTERKRLLSEGALGMRLRHEEYLIKILKVGQVEQVPYLIMELAPGKTLREILTERKQLTDGEVLRLALAMAHALRYLHSNGVYHKDVKPDNIVVSGTHSIKLLDLGFAESRAGSFLTRLFSSNAGKPLEGSPAYLAPELIRTRQASPGTDIYALGCTLYECAAGCVPFGGNSDQEIMARQVDIQRRPRIRTRYNQRISHETQRLILKAIEKQPRHRFPTADELWLELHRHPATRHHRTVV
jgi:serine/threonine protein kinase